MEKYQKCERMFVKMTANIYTAKCHYQTVKMDTKSKSKKAIFHRQIAR